jgi:uncharacterized RDD family membrane protein YckC
MTHDPPREGLDERMQIDTPELVQLQLVVAGAGNRFLALLLDLIIQVLALLGVFLVFGLIAYLAPGPAREALKAVMDRAGVWIWAAIVLGSFLVYWGYFVLFETVWAGQTPGKRLLQIRVVREDGRPIGFSEAAIRNLVRVVLDAQPANVYAVGFLVTLLNAKSKRLGDYAAGTVVIRERRVAVPPAGARLRPTAEPVMERAGRQVRQLTKEEAAVLQAYLRRRGDLDPKTRAEMARTIALSLMQHLEVPRPVDVSYDAFLEWLDAEMKKGQIYR